MQKQPQDRQTQISLTILATSDVHGSLSSYDALADTHQPSGGLTRISSYVSDMRKTAANCLLLDNGDFLQGAAICDLAAMGDLDQFAKHPVLKAMNHLKYDAVGLGNHELDYGLTYLRKCLAQAEFPVVSSNLGCVRQPWKSELILERKVCDQNGKEHTLKIGILSVMPQQVVEWNRIHLRNEIAALNPVAAAKTRAAHLKSMGADLIIALAHTGIGAIDPPVDAENVAIPIAKIQHIDAVICGHTHQIFPTPTHTTQSVIDSKNGRIHGKPAVMAGFNASYLGKIDLELQNLKDQWQVTQSTTEVIAMVPKEAQRDGTAQDIELLEKLAPYQSATRRKLQRKIGTVNQPIHSYFARLPGDPSCALTALAKFQFAQSDANQHTLPDLPILAASSPFRSGGKAGPTYFTDVKSGPVTSGDLYELHPFQNTISALQINGRQLKDWLEMSASSFRQVRPRTRRQTLKDPSFPCYGFDTVYGVTYQIDLFEPAKYDVLGRIKHGGPGKRIRKLQWQGQDVAPDQEFILLTNSYRAGGGGNFPHAADAKRVDITPQDLRELVADTIANGFDPDDLPTAPWQFTPLRDASAIFLTGPGARQVVNEADHLPLTEVGMNDDGFLEYRLDLAPKRAQASLAIPSSSAYITC
ncbi:bifunctional 2',3'-cyclic-nucleotide 2'-phosphodiesterase/3'-nucleotidase [Cognatishimia sp. 1_MG-2023]|uniref:bifunctional 2',3'-cyclic-nucleotide 2'-phosphodiesterase/3'-nucleotidase n=1 Tax=Cognatishimia sp. 1_MG-2023 TaxID=3062642 RepID=UPI0026E39EC0|nr:bifunctional 2',3'-cyclic-nucleotide 2'-phosphodiesterase/3'-nucleotidase [Cognatishimia sp. 1_MG-2023]MDO6727551.1 bifunctional 2',3'-cyclic-nucleotide 2'-phosphodiesterase/3'-nucleotidase [Cognatishimia sp. 1_MG-2023]